MGVAPSGGSVDHQHLRNTDDAAASLFRGLRRRCLHGEEGFPGGT